MRAEAARSVKILFALGHEGGDRDRVCLLARIDDPHELRVPVFFLGAGFVGDDEIRPVAERPAGMGRAGERGRPFDVTDELHRP